MNFDLTDSLNEILVSAAAATRPWADRPDLESDVLQLFEKHRNPLLRYVLSMGLTVHDAEEVTQETFIFLFRHLQGNKSRENLPGWIFRVAHNLALKQRHANQKSRDTLTWDPALAENHLDPSPNPEEQASFRQTRRRMRAVFAALPEQDQCCLRLRAEGLRYREIAQVLGISLGAISISLTRSLARLVRAEGSASHVD
jgi:RNA polymerase sigma-70 factor, ECF subfamily